MTAPGPTDTASILARVARIPEGFVACFSDVCPSAPRHAGAVLSRAIDTTGAPWWRVVRTDGSVPCGERQERRLHEEGVPFRGARVDVRAARIPAEALD